MKHRKRCIHTNPEYEYASTLIMSRDTTVKSYVLTLKVGLKKCWFKKRVAYTITLYYIMIICTSILSVGLGRGG